MEKEDPRANPREETAEGSGHEDRRFSERGRMMRAIAALFDDLVAAPRAGGPERLWTSDQSLAPPCAFREKRVANRMLLATTAFALALSAGHRDAGAQVTALMQWAPSKGWQADWPQIKKCSERPWSEGTWSATFQCVLMIDSYSAGYAAGQKTPRKPNPYEPEIK